MAPLASTADWSNYTNVPVPSNAATLLAASSAAIRNYCGWTISREVLTDQEIDTKGTGLFFLPTLKLESIEALSVGGTSFVPGTDYQFSTKGMVRRLPYGYIWPRGFRAVKISYTHGYATVPEDIVALTVGMASGLASPPPPNVAQKVVGAISITYAQRSSSVSLDEASMAILDAYALGQV